MADEPTSPLLTAADALAADLGELASTTAEADYAYYLLYHYGPDYADLFALNMQAVERRRGLAFDNLRGNWQTFAEILAGLIAPPPAYDFSAWLRDFEERTGKTPEDFGAEFLTELDKMIGANVGA